MNVKNKQLVKDFIEQVWNENHLDRIDDFLHPQFNDYSLPITLPADKEGLRSWIIGTGSAFDHHTTIEEMVCEDNRVMIKITMRLKHTGTWRGLEPTGADINTTGYRFFKISEGKLAEHWALIDGNAIEKQIRETKPGSVL